MKQIGTILINGCDGEFIYDKNGIVKRKPRINKRRYKEDPSYAKFKGNGIEFGRAAKAGKLIKNAVLDMAEEIKDANWQSRVTKTIYACIKDSSLTPGNGTVADSNLFKLKGLEFNIHCPLLKILLVKFNTSINRNDGTLSVSFPSFSTKDSINSPLAATHVQLLSAGIAIDFDRENSIPHEQHSPILPLNYDVINSFELAHQLAGITTEALFLLVGVRFFSEANGIMYPLSDKKYNTLSVIDVSNQV